MNTLYIIGNGFDLYHGLNTSYKSFGFYLKEKHSEIYDYLIDYYGLPYLDDPDINYYEWNSFESALADLNYESVLEDNSDYLPNPASDDFRDGDWHALEQVMEGLVNDLTINLFNEFKNFIRNVEFPIKDNNELLNIDKNSKFLSFNYTDTLERYYGISSNNILYIHNKALSNDILILGHGTNPESFVKVEEKMPNNLTIEEQQEWYERMSDNYDFSYDRGLDTILGYFNKSFKYTEDLINQNNNFFNNLNSIKKVVVLGQSVSDVDQPYFRKIIDSIEDKDIKWTSSYYGDKQPLYENLKSIGLHYEQIDFITLDEIRQEDKNQLKLF
ncbi:bacteriophage abortive infection AbiH family protein [Flavobacterium sp. P4023]|uniref:Bacteriophage abortive infection AbiH family protein n=1 Tax=Flavobacterium flabelliforme TaxID=2816119 RepID=A0ABS5CTL4_9FLAO|nr:bacteriophage abortive infection AbiH family protein [Flavobacterium flabelliforme]MBP4141961.1 bacteriophage abortive infection AbiH family protein [Flavobacterium flabelliforme]